MALRLRLNGVDDSFFVAQMLRPLAVIAPLHSRSALLLTKMQTERTHMALVTRIGGVDGLVTSRDLIEQGHRRDRDEHDIEEAQPWSRENEGQWLALARAPLDEFEAELGIALSEVDDEEEVDTLGGLVFLLSGRVPARGEVVPHPSGVEFEVIDADPRRIKRLRVRLPKGLAG